MLTNGSLLFLWKSPPVLVDQPRGLNSRLLPDTVIGIGDGDLNEEKH